MNEVNSRTSYQSMFRFNRNYFGVAALIFIVEVLIALFVHDNFIRPYIGDVLVVILIYCFLKSFLSLPELALAIFVLAFSFTIELLQYFQIVEKLDLEKSNIARTVIGTSFAWIDLIAYTIGVGVILVVEKCFLHRKLSSGI